MVSYGMHYFRAYVFTYFSSPVRQFALMICKLTKKGSLQGNYTQYCAAKAERIAMQWAAYEKHQKEIARQVCCEQDSLSCAYRRLPKVAIVLQRLLQSCRGHHACLRRFRLCSSRACLNHRLSTNIFALRITFACKSMHPCLQM